MATPGWPLVTRARCANCCSKRCTSRSAAACAPSVKRHSASRCALSCSSSVPTPPCSSRRSCKPAVSGHARHVSVPGSQASRRCSVKMTRPAAKRSSALRSTSSVASAFSSGASTACAADIEKSAKTAEAFTESCCMDCFSHSWRCQALWLCAMQHLTLETPCRLTPLHWRTIPLFLFFIPARSH